MLQESTPHAGGWQPVWSIPLGRTLRRAKHTHKRVPGLERIRLSGMFFGVWCEGLGLAGAERRTGPQCRQEEAVSYPPLT
jgi:hypothetical protein